MSTNQPLNQSLSRRHFLKFISLGFFSTSFSLTACTHKKFYNPDQDIILGGGRFKQNNKLRHVLAIANIQQKETQLIDLDFLAHGILIDPKNKKRFITFEKNGTSAAEIDLDKKTTAKNLQPAEGNYFSGHGVFNKTGDNLFCVETSSNSREGVITIHDGNNFKTLGKFSSYGKNPHQCQLTNDGAIIVVTNAGIAENAKPSVTYIDTQTQQLIERVTLSNQQLNAGHIAIANDGSLVVSSAASSTPDKSTKKKLGGVSIRSQKHAMLSMAQPKVVINKMTGEALSIALDEKHDVAAITHPDANMVTFWSIHKRKLLKAISVAQPKGVTLSLDEKSFIISYDINTSIVLINTKDLSADTHSIMQPSYISGEHIYNWSKILTEIMPTNIY